MATLQSVGVQVTESDLTQVTQPTSTSIGAYVGHFNWGPADEVTNVSSETTLGKIFGTPNKSDDVNAASFLTAESFLKYGNSLKVIRAVDNASAKNAAGVADYTGTSEFATLIKNKTEFDNLSTAELQAPLQARYPGELGNSLGVQIFHKSNQAVTLTESKKFFSVLANTTSWASDVAETELISDEVHVAIYDEKGLISGTKGTVLETWQGLSLHPNARGTNGSNNYWADVINLGSQYVYVNTELGDGVATLEANTYALTGSGFYSFVGGLNGIRESNNVINSLGILEDTDNIDINLIFAESFIDDFTNKINAELIAVAEVRKDSLVFLSAPLNLYTIASDTAKLTALKNAKDSFLSTSNAVLSYTVFDSTPVYVYNKYADRYEWIPACGHMAGLCAYTDEISDPWFSPAGFNRGQLRGVTKLAYNPKNADRDDLYNSNINPIINVIGQGIILYGDKTGQTRPSAFDRINVRRLFITIQRVCAQAAKFQLFELNDEFTRNAFINIVDPYLRDVQGRRGVTDYKIVCNETNNTPQVIDTNRFVADIYIKPSRSINYISLNFIATRTGVAFTEIGA